MVTPKYDWAPATAYDKDGKFDPELFGKHYTETVAPQLTAHAANEVKRLSLPAKPEEYKLELPKDFKLPQGVEFKLDTAKPEFSKFQQVAHKHGLTPDAVTDMLGVYAETLVGSQASIQAARQAEVAKLGANGPARVTALDTFFTGLLGADKAKHISGMNVTAGITEALESIVAKFTSQGTASFRQDFREPREPQGRLSQAELEKMTAAQRFTYAQQFDQKQFQKPERAA